MKPGTQRIPAIYVMIPAYDASVANLARKVIWYIFNVFS